jgi:membrane protease YdiL (CAAX protease family)
MEIFRERPRQTANAIGGTWLAFAMALYLALPQPVHPTQLLGGAFVGAILITSGFFVHSRCRAVSSRPFSQRAKLAALALLFGTLLGAALLAALSVLTRFEPALRARFAGRLAEPIWRPWALAFESSILEEITFRLFAMSLLVWFAVRLFKKTRASFIVGLIGSALLFGIAHLPAWLSLVHFTFALLTVVLLLNGVGGLLLGWVYWRWGLPYAIFCHFAGDVVLQVFGPHLLA